MSARRRPLAPALERFYVSLELAGLKPRTIAAYRYELRSSLRSAKDLREMTAEELARTLVGLARTRSPASLAVSSGRLRRLFRWLFEEGLVLRDPAAALRPPRALRRLPRILSEAAVLELLAAPDVATWCGLRDRAILELFYSSALRRGELAALRIADIDLAEGIVHVRESKTGHGRRVPVGKTAIRWLRRYLAKARPRPDRGRASGALFVTGRGDAASPRVVGRWVLENARRSGLRGVGAHALRHACATHMLRHGASTRDLQELLGHRRLDSTQLYTRVLPQDLQEVLQRAHPRERAARRKERRRRR